MNGRHLAVLRRMKQRLKIHYKCYLTHICSISETPQLKDELHPAICTAVRDVRRSRPTAGEPLCFIRRSSPERYKSKKGLLCEHLCSGSVLRSLLDSEKLRLSFIILYKILSCLINLMQRGKSLVTV